MSMTTDGRAGARHPNDPRRTGCRRARPPPVGSEHGQRRRLMAGPTNDATTKRGVREKKAPARHTNHGEESI